MEESLPQQQEAISVAQRAPFPGLGMQVGSQKATLGTRNSRPEAVSILQWHGFWLRLEGLRAQVGVQVGATVVSGRFRKQR